MRNSPAMIVILMTATVTSAQPERYELGRRLKAFEQAWEKHEGEAARLRALKDLPKVTTQFFSFQLGEASRTLDLAAHALHTDTPPAGNALWAWSLYAIPETRVVDGAARELAVTIKQFYPVKGDIPSGVELRLWFTEKHVVVVKPEKFPMTVKVPLPPLGESPGLDRKLYFLVDGVKGVSPTIIGISQIADLKPRLEKLGTQTAGKNDTIEQATARARGALIAGAASGKGTLPPTDLPYADFLANAERMVAGKPFFTPEKIGQFWLSIPLGSGREAACRMYIPKGLDPKKPVPIIVGLHGAGVDENMFFESYGAGQLLKECEKRGWILVCPRSGLGGAGSPAMAIVEKLAERFPIDRKRIILVGHSMGAMQAMTQASSGGFAAVAALGGGGRVSKLDAFATLPTFIGVGDKDSLALSGARSLNKTLTAASAKALTYKEYPGVEHLVIVRAALADAFTVFDEVCGK